MNQVLANALYGSALTCVFALSFALLYRLVRFFELGPAIGALTGAYCGWAAGTVAGSVSVSLGVGVASAAVMGTLLATLWSVSARLREVGRSQKFLASLGLVAVAQSTIALIFGDGTRMIRGVPQQHVELLGARLSLVQTLTIVLAMCLVGMLLAGLRLRPFGLWYRAVCGDRELALVSGVPVARVEVLAYATAMGIAGLGGIAIGADVGLTPGMGFRGVLAGVVATLVGGVGSLGAVVGASILIGLLQAYTGWFFGTLWREAVVFGLLGLVLILRPQGLFTR